MIRIFNGKIIAPDGIEDKKVILIKDTKIWDICSLDKMPQGKFQDVDTDGAYIIPGLIDIHSDALEFKFSPRPNVNIQTSMALSYYEKELLSCGITTQFHGIYWGDVLEEHRSLKIAKEMIRKILDYRKKSRVINHKIFIRFDIANCEAKEELLHLINNKNVDLISFQYHLPGQAQFKDIQAFKNYYVKVRGWSEQELNEFMENNKIGIGINVKLINGSLKSLKNVLNNVNKAGFINPKDCSFVIELRPRYFEYIKESKEMMESLIL